MGHCVRLSYETTRIVRLYFLGVYLCEEENLIPSLPTAPNQWKAILLASRFRRMASMLWSITLPMYVFVIVILRFIP